MVLLLLLLSGGWLEDFEQLVVDFEELEEHLEHLVLVLVLAGMQISLWLSLVLAGMQISFFRPTCPPC